MADAQQLAESMEMDGAPPGVAGGKQPLLAEVEWDDGSIPLATSYLDRALEVAGDDLAEPRISARSS